MASASLDPVLRGIVKPILFALALALATAVPVLAADPTPAPTPVASPVLIDPLDPRAGEGASSIGAPLLALLVVVGMGVTAAGLTYAYAKVMGNR